MKAINIEGAIDKSSLLVSQFRKNLQYLIPKIDFIFWVHQKYFRQLHT